MGKFAPRPIISEQIALAAAVAAITGSCGIPAADKMAAFANRMYAMVRNVASPPRTSRAGVVPRAVSWKSRSSTRNP